MTCPVATFSTMREAREYAKAGHPSVRVKAAWCDEHNGYHPRIVDTEVPPVPPTEPPPSEPPTIAPPQRHRCRETGKVSYAGEREARLASLAGARGARVRPYRCPHCQRWHITASVAEGGRGRGER
jgi:hypothetical protein